MTEQQKEDDIAFKAWRDTRVTPDAYSAWHGALAHERQRTASRIATVIEVVRAQPIHYHVATTILQALALDGKRSTGGGA